jgi:GAF domain-containing protein
MLLNEETAELEVRSVAGDEAASILGHRQKVGDGVAGRVAQDGKPLVLGGRVDSHEFRDYRERQSRPSASMVVPVVLREELIGVLAINAVAPGQSYHEDDLRILQIFASIVGVCIRHYQQAEWMRETIRGLQSVLETQGPTNPPVRDLEGEAA